MKRLGILIIVATFLIAACKQNTDKAAGPPYPTITQNTNAVKTENNTNSIKTEDNKDIKYLLIFKGYPPHEKKERNLYEFAHRIITFIDGDIYPPTGIGIAGWQGARYGVFSIIKTKVLRKTDSRHSPRSQNDGVYVLIHDPLYLLCAKSYTISGSKITYIDYENSKRYIFPITVKRPFEIYKVEALTGNVMRELWEENRIRKAR